MRFMQFRARDAYALHLSKMEKVHLSPHDHIDGPERIIESLSPVTISLLLSLVFGLVYMSSPIHLSRPDPDQPRVAAYYGSCQLVPTCTSVTLPLGDNTKAHVNLQQHLMSVQRAWHTYITVIWHAFWCLCTVLHFLYICIWNILQVAHIIMFVANTAYSVRSQFLGSISNHNFSYLDHNIFQLSWVCSGIFWGGYGGLWEGVLGGGFPDTFHPSPGHRCRLYGV